MVFYENEKVTTSGFAGRVVRMYSEGMVEVRLESGMVCVAVEDVIRNSLCIHPELQSHETCVAMWKTKGHDFLILYRYVSEKFGTTYAYRGSGCGGGVEAKDDEAAIREMERPWGGDNKPGAGQAFVLKLDRPSLKRTYSILEEK